MIQTWKLPHLLKGTLTYVPLLNAWRLRRGSTGGSNSARYCYAVWLRHLVVLARHGFAVSGTVVAELGPGDSIGTGLAALLSGADRYVGLDVMPYSAHANLEGILAELADLYSAKEAIPGHDAFPRIRPRLACYDFPSPLVASESLPEKLARIRSDLGAGTLRGDCVSYHAPWTSVMAVAPGSLDLIFSQAVLQYVDDLAETYRTMFAWLKPGGYCSHSTGLGAVDLSPYWNGHWAYTDREWRMVRGRREWIINREPLSSHVSHARHAGFEVLSVDREYDGGGLPVTALTPRFQTLAPEDLRTRGVMLILQKPR
jgi:hypothetical protein